MTDRIGTWTVRGILGIIGLMIAVAGLAMCSHARAQVTVPGQPMVPLGYCQLASLGSSTGLASCSGGIPAGSNTVILRAEAQALRYRLDGTAPTATVGMPLLVADPAIFFQAGTTGLSALRFIEQTGGGKLDVLFFRAPQ